MAFGVPFSRYLPSTDRARAWQLWCLDAGTAQVAPGSAYPPSTALHPDRYARTVQKGRVLDEYQMVYLSRGRGTYRDAAGRSHLVEEGSMLLVFPGVMHSYSPDPETGWDEWWVGFAGPLADQLVAQGFFSVQRPVLFPGLREEYLHAFAELVALAREGKPGFQYELGAIVLRLLARLAADAERREQHSRAEELVTRARAWMEARVEDELDVNALAAELFLGYENFRRIFKRYTGLAPYRYFLQLKIARAKALLADGATVKETAARLSFENQYYFSRAFKLQTGRSPSQWQRRQGT